MLILLRISSSDIVMDLYRSLKLKISLILFIAIYASDIVLTHKYKERQTNKQVKKFLSCDQFNHQFLDPVSVGA